MDLRREKDIEQLRKVALVQQQQLEKLLGVLATQSEHIDALTGTTGEQQRALGLLEASAGQAAPSQSNARRPRRKKDKKKKKRTAFGPTPQPKVPVVKQLFELDEADRSCPACGGALEPFEGQFDKTEMVDVVQVEYRIVRCKQQKYVCACGGCVETALGPERATSGGRYSLDFAIKVAIDKYLDHLPLQRQARILKRHALVVTAQTLSKQLDVLARGLAPTLELLEDAILGNTRGVIGLDQTSWKRLSTARATPYQMWCVTSEGAVVHSIRDDKATGTLLYYPSSSPSDLAGRTPLGSEVRTRSDSHGASLWDAPAPPIAISIAT
ncbi:MAG: transposase [Planctomycetota bacterium]